VRGGAGGLFGPMNVKREVEMKDRTGRRTRAAVAVGAVLAGMTVPALAAEAAPPSCEVRDNNQYRKLLECVSGAGVQEHLQAFQDIADANEGTRADQTPGYTASAGYVEDVMTAAGWTVTRVPFDYNAATVVLEQETPVEEDWPANDATGTGEGNLDDVAVVPVDIVIGQDPVINNANDSGCEEADFADFPAGAIALIQRGTCSFAIKAANAQAAGAAGVVLFNQGNVTDDPAAGDRLGPVNPTLGTFVASIPVVGTSYAAGVSLAADGSTADLVVDFFVATSENVIAEKAGLDPANVVMAGAHLDSVPEGPGINDNGSGSAALLEVGQNLAGHVPQNTLRFAWWGAEEVGLQGSTAWVGQQSQAELDKIALYMNFDMVGSPNYIYMVYDADQSTFEAPVPVPDGSIAIEDTFETYFSTVGIPYEDSEFSGRSDYQAFIEADIPSSGLFTGAEVRKTELQQEIWGGEAGEQFDPCYHAECDDIDNIAAEALDVNTDAIAFAVLTYAYSTESVNGVPGVPVPGRFTTAPINGEEGTFREPTMARTAAVAAPVDPHVRVDAVDS
jgi:Zn-dependent M28 family amino/carboxypeptidase